jgi:linearmycin/streptolysin S transport system ATP-binding protein
MALMTEVPRRQTPTATVVLEVRGAEKAFGATRALLGASLELREGECLALLGPNGAGKTTLLRALTGRVRLDRGAVRMFGRELPPEERRAALGIVPQEIAVYPLLSARENLDAFGRLHGVAPAKLRARIEWALAWTGLAERAREPVEKFSGGMKRRLNIACGVLHEPRVVLLDEPTVGVDPQSRERIYEMLDALREGGASLLLTTHHLEEAERRCDRIVILDHGHEVAEGTLAELIERTVGGGRDVVVHLDRDAARPVEGFERGADARTWRARVHDVAGELPGLLGRVDASGARVEDLEIRRQGLHEVFLHLTGRELRE